MSQHPVVHEYRGILVPPQITQDWDSIKASFWCLGVDSASGTVDHSREDSRVVLAASAYLRKLGHDSAAEALFTMPLTEVQR